MSCSAKPFRQESIPQLTLVVAEIRDYFVVWIAARVTLRHEHAHRYNGLERRADHKHRYCVSATVG